MKQLLLCAWLVVFALTPLYTAHAKPTLLSAKTEQCAELNTAYTPITQRYKRGIFFRIEKCGYPASYIMGTMHSDSPKLLAIYNDAMAIARGMRAVGFEFVEDDRTSAIAAQFMYLPSSFPGGLSSMIPAEQFDQLATALQQRMKTPRQSTNRLRPWAASISLQYPPPVADGVVLDKRLQNYARATQKMRFSLESPAEQFRIFDSIPMDKQLVMLRDTVNSIEELDESNAEFMQTYIDRDLKTMHRLADESFAMTSDHNLRVYIEENLLYKRNRTMAQRLQPHLIKGNVLVAIGALHLMGEKGMLRNLEKAGWRIEPVR